MKNWFLIVAVGLALVPLSSYAAKVTQVKNNKVLLSLDGTDAAEGSEFFVLNGQGKKVAIIRVKQVKNGKAIADIVKGTAQAGYSLQAKAGSGGGGGGSTPSYSSDDYYSKKLSNRMANGNSWGIIGGYMMDSMTAKWVVKDGLGNVQRTPSVSMTGSGLGGLGFYDYALNEKFTLRGAVGLEQYNVAGSDTNGDCSGSNDCNVKLMYLSMYGYGKWNFLMRQGYKAWVGGGAGYLYAMSKSSTVLNASDLSANQIMVVNAGIDFKLNPKHYVPVSLEYGLFPSSASVSASIMYLRVGYAWNL